MGTRASNAEVARAVLSVPEVAGAFADAALLAKVREIVDEWQEGDDANGTPAIIAIATLFDGGDRP
jgi:hypothetical protein